MVYSIYDWQNIENNSLPDDEAANDCVYDEDYDYESSFFEKDLNLTSIGENL